MSRCMYLPIYRLWGVGARKVLLSEIFKDFLCFKQTLFLLLSIRFDKQEVSLRSSGNTPHLSARLRCRLQAFIWVGLPMCFLGPAVHRCTSVSTLQSWLQVVLISHPSPMHSLLPFPRSSEAENVRYSSNHLWGQESSSPQQLQCSRSRPPD